MTPLPFVLVAVVVGAISLHLYPVAKARAAELAQKEQASIRIGGLRAGGFTEFDKGRFMVYSRFPWS